MAFWFSPHINDGKILAQKHLRCHQYDACSPLWAHCTKSQKTHKSKIYDIKFLYQRWQEMQITVKNHQDFFRDKMYKHFISCLTTKYYDFSGRSSRAEYCGYIFVYFTLRTIDSFIGSANIILALVGLAAGISLIVPFRKITGTKYSNCLMAYLALRVTECFITSPNAFFIIIGLIIAIFFMIPTLAVISRRIHDIGYSFLWLFAPCVLSYSFYLFDSEIIRGIRILIIYALYSSIIAMMFIRGSKEENKYGLPPESIKQ